MENKTSKKSTNKPDLGGLLGSISENRKDIAPSPLQVVVPVESVSAGEISAVSEPAPEPITDTQDTPVKQKPARNTVVKTEKKSIPKDTIKKTGRPSVKPEEVLYTRLSPRIPSDLKMDLDIAIARRMFSDKKGMVISTIDEFITEALQRMLKDKK